MNGSFYNFVLYPFEHLSLGKLRTYLLNNAQGKVLEIGAGTGLNLNHYPQDVKEILATDNDEAMLAQAKKHFPEGFIHFEIVDAQALPYPVNEFDTVVATLVFCSIPNPDAALKEVYRVLKPGGTFLLLEHVRKNTPFVGKTLDTITPLWKIMAGGCHLNRDPSKSIEALGFKQESIDVLWKGLGKMWRLKK